MSCCGRRGEVEAVCRRFLSEHRAGQADRTRALSTSRTVATEVCVRYLSCAPCKNPERGRQQSSYDVRPTATRSCPGRSGQARRRITRSRKCPVTGGYGDARATVFGSASGSTVQLLGSGSGTLREADSSTTGWEESDKNRRILAIAGGAPADRLENCLDVPHSPHGAGRSTRWYTANSRESR